jgi:hypothetical protein
MTSKAGTSLRSEGRTVAESPTSVAWPGVEPEWPERDSREWLLGPRGASLEPWADAVDHLPGGDAAGAAVLCVAQTPPTVWVREDLLDELALWDALAQAVKAYDQGDREPPRWIEVPGADGHLAVFAVA